MDENREGKDLSTASAPPVEAAPYQRPFQTIRKLRTRLPRVMVPILLVQYVLRGKAPIDLYPFTHVEPESAVAICLIALGAVIRAWARGFHVSGTLFTRGPYAVMRHPLYLGTILVGIGMCIILNDWVIDLAFLAYFCVIYPATMFSEDDVMKMKFGAVHADYQDRVPAIFPYKLSLWKREELSGWRMKVFLNTTEPGSLILILLIPVFLELFEEGLRWLRWLP